MNLKTLSRHLDAIRDTNHARLRSGVLRWAKVCIDHPSRPDGYPTSASGADRTLGAGSRPTDETAELRHLHTGGDLHEFGHAPASNDTSVERAATAKKARDQIEMNTMAVVGWVVQIDDLYRRIEAKLLENERIQSTADLNPEPACWFMAQIDVYEPKHVKTDFAGILPQPLDEPRYVGRWCYDYVRATGTIPTREQRRQHARGERVMVAA